MPIPWQKASETSFRAHNEAVARLWRDYAHGSNQRVPVTLAFDEQFLLPLFGCTFRHYYQNVAAQIRVQLDSQHWIRTKVRHDAEMGLPDVWRVSPAGWMTENEFLGATVLVQENDYAWGQPIPATKSELLEWLRGMDPLARVQECTLWQQYVDMTECTRNMQYHGRPVETAMPVTSSHGVFTKAAEIRGLDRLCADIHDDPAFAKELLAIVTDLLIARIENWHTLAGVDRAFPSADSWGLADDSLAMISTRQYEEFVLPCHEKFYSRMTSGTRTIHLCGHAQHLFPTLHARLGVTVFNGPGPQIDLLRMIDEINAPIEIEAEVAHATLQRSRTKIEKEILQLLQEEVKTRAKITLTGYVPRGTPRENMEFFYAWGKEHGRIPRRRYESSGTSRAADS